MPEEGVDLAPKADVLTLEEMARVVRVLVRAGVRRVRITGGEPTVRHGLTEFIAQLAALGLDDLAMTTNGHVLAPIAADLRRAGLRRLNVSVDTLDPMRFKQITRWGDLRHVTDGIEAARAAGFTGTKINTVALAGWNDQELPSLAAWAWEKGLTPRFIEWMPMSDGALFAPGAFLPAAAVRDAIARGFGPLVPDEGAGIPGVGPARYLHLAADPTRRLGIISAVSEPFCETCNRVRLTATGQLHTCLGRDDAVALRPLVRAHLDDDEILARVRAGVAQKAAGHEFTPTGCGGPRKHMVAIGG
jgi:cyclic pyranopterin phosphate synthase